MNKLTKSRTRLPVIFFVLMTSILALVGCTDSSDSRVPRSGSVNSTSKSDVSSIEVIAVNMEAGDLTFSVLMPSESQTMSLADFDVIDTSCLLMYRWSATDEDLLRQAILRQGCVSLKEGAGTDDEQGWQELAADRNLGIWEHASSSPTEGSSPSFSTDVGSMAVVSNWIHLAIEWGRKNPGKTLSFLLAIPGTWWYMRLRYQKRVRVVLCGPPASGKTDFWTALRMKSAPDSNATPTTGTQRSHLAEMTLGRYTLHPQAIDTAGSEPWRVIDQSGISRLMRWRNKLVLVVVFSPTRANSKSSAIWDTPYITEQSGYTSLPSALIGSRKRSLRPDVVICFLSKFDLFSDGSPEDPAAKDQRDRYYLEFARHRAQLEKACRTAKIPFTCITGSSKRSWGIQEVNTFLTRELVTKR